MAPVGVPQSLDRFRPIRDFLYLVDSQHEAPFRTLRRQHPSSVPNDALATGSPSRRWAAGVARAENGTILTSGPGTGGSVTWIGFVNRKVEVAPVDLVQYLLDNRGLARLARPGNDDQPLGFLAQACEECRFLCRVHRRSFLYDTFMSIFTQ